ncbi:hypothetical protein Bca4012_020530 [Brassica carinata]|uniref:Uncharacterized protein n=1 Tax=Brassica carinata TaxID=52824 RepID=A0A8X7WFH1_BRACI|nr:hypothetical protein Bca52824_001123 [Brassica carinata]
MSTSGFSLFLGLLQLVVLSLPSRTSAIRREGLKNNCSRRYLISDDEVAFKSREDHRKQIELEEARKAGLAPADRRGGVTVVLLGLASLQVHTVAVLIGGIWDLGSSAVSSKPYPSLFSLESSEESQYLGGALRAILLFPVVFYGYLVVISPFPLSSDLLYAVLLSVSPEVSGRSLFWISSGSSSFSLSSLTPRVSLTGHRFCLRLSEPAIGVVAASLL